MGLSGDSWISDCEDGSLHTVSVVAYTVLWNKDGMGYTFILLLLVDMAVLAGLAGKCVTKRLTSLPCEINFYVPVTYVHTRQCRRV